MGEAVLSAKCRQQQCSQDSFDCCTEDELNTNSLDNTAVPGLEVCDDLLKGRNCVLPEAPVVVGGQQVRSAPMRPTVVAQQQGGLIHRHPSVICNTATIRHPSSSNFNHHQQLNRQEQQQQPVGQPQLQQLHKCCQQHKLGSQSSIPGLSFYQSLHSNGNGSTPNISRSFAMEMRDARAKAILVDRFSRVFFPLSFTILNIMYWYVYFEW